MKIAIIGHGIIGEAFKKLVKYHYDVVTYDPKYNKTYPAKEIDSSDLAVICVPTNQKEDGSCDVSIVEKTIKKLNTKLILIKSTVEPKTTERIKKETGKRIVFSPEYIGESKYHHPYWIDMVDVPYFIVGGDEKDREEVINIIEPIMGSTVFYYQCSSTEAELIKYMENTFFATKVTFCNEFFDICEKLGADWHKVREGWLLDPRINKMHTSVFKYNRGFSGKCFPKDLKAIISKMDKEGYSADLLKQVDKENEEIKKRNKIH